MLGSNHTGYARPANWRYKWCILYIVYDYTGLCVTSKFFERFFTIYLAQNMLFISSHPNINFDNRHRSPSSSLHQASLALSLSQETIVIPSLSRIPFPYYASKHSFFFNLRRSTLRFRLTSYNR